MINNIFNIYDEKFEQTENKNCNIQYNMQNFDDLLDSMLIKKNSNVLYKNTEIEIKWKRLHAKPFYF